MATAAVPTITGLTPAPNSSSAAASAADSPAGLTGCHRGGERPRPPGCRPSGPGGVEVHDVKPSRPGRLKSLGTRDGVVAVYRLPAEIALSEAHATAVPSGRWQARGPPIGTLLRSWPSMPGPPRRLLGMELRGPDFARLDRGRHRPPVVTGGYRLGATGGA